MELTYKNAHRISSGITFIISIIWWSIFELPFESDKNRFDMYVYFLFYNILIDII